MTSSQHTKKQESARPETIRRLLSSGAFVYIRVSSNRPPSVRFGFLVATQPRNCLGRVATTHATTTGQPLLTHNPLHTSAVTHFTISRWKPPGCQLIDHGVTRHTYAYATFNKAGMVATHSAPSNSTNRITSDYTVMKNGTASPQLTISWSQGQSTSHCNLATQSQCSSCKGSHRQFRCDECFKLQHKQCFSCSKQLQVGFNCLHPFSKDKIKQMIRGLQQ